MPLPVPVRLPMAPVPFRVPPEETLKLVVCAVELLISTTPEETTVVVLVLAPEIVVKPAPEVLGVKLKAPEIIPGSAILPIPAFRVVSAPRITPVFASPRVMRVLVVATVPLIETEEGAVTLRPPVKVNVSPPSPRVTVPVLRKSTLLAKVLPVPVMLTVVAVAAVIKPLTVTAPVNATEAPLVMVRLLIATVVPVIAPPVRAFSPRLKEPEPSVMPAPKTMSSPAPAPVDMSTSLVNVTPRRNEMPSLVLAICPPMLLNPAPA